MTETYANYHSDSDKMWVSTNERAMITKMMRYDGHGMTVLRSPEENDGYLYCEVPKSWLKVVPPRKLNLSEDERAVRRERLKAVKTNG